MDLTNLYTNLHVTDKKMQERVLTLFTLYNIA